MKKFIIVPSLNREFYYLITEIYSVIISQHAGKRDRAWSDTRSEIKQKYRYGK